MNIKISLFFSTLIAIIVFSSQVSYADYSSACGGGGSAGQECGCGARYVCSGNNCGCQTDKYCQDTNCPTNNTPPNIDNPRNVEGESKLNLDRFNINRSIKIVPSKS